MHSYPATESQQQLQHFRGLSSSTSIASDRDDDLSLFSDMQRREREYKASFPGISQMQTPRSCKAMNHSLQRAPAGIPTNGYGADDPFLSDCGKTDYDWLLTPPGTPVMASVAGAASVRPAFKTSKLGNSNVDRAEHRSKNVRGNLGLQKPLNVDAVGSGGGPRSSTQGNYNTAARVSTPSSTHASRHAPVGTIASTRPASLASMGIPQATTQNGGVCAVTPSAQATFPSHRSLYSFRSLTPVKRAPSPSHPCNPPTTLVRCSSASRATSMMLKGASLSRACSPTSKAWFPEALHGFSQERPPNLRTSIPDRVLSNPRSSTTKTSQAERSDMVIQNRRHSSSSTVAKGPLSRSKVTQLNAALDGHAADILAAKCSISNVGAKAGRSQGAQNLLLDSHVQKQARSTPLRDVKSIFSSIRESSSLKPNPSKRSLDLTPRHMDTCKSTPQKFRSFVSSISKPRGLGRLGVEGSGTNALHTKTSVVDSPLATSSSTSSEHNMSIVIDPDSSEFGDETISERESRSSAASQHDLLFLGKDKRITSWLRTPDYRDDEVDIMQIFEQEGLESLSGPESPLISDLDGTIECEDFSLGPI